MIARIHAQDFTSTFLSETGTDPTGGQFADPMAIINALLPYMLTLTGLILLVMLIMGGFGMLTAATDAKKAEAAKARITASLIGFFIIFAAYWIVQILEIVLGVKILSPWTNSAKFFKHIILKRAAGPRKKLILKSHLHLVP